MVLCHRKDVFQRRFSYNCPRSDEPLLKYCCAPDDRSATCCQYPSSTAGVNNIYGLDADDHEDGVGEFVTSVVGGVIVLVMLVCCVSCFCCPFCALHKWRKNRGRTRNPNPSATGVNAVPLSSFAQQPASGYPSGPAAAYPSQQGYPMPQPQGYPMPQPQGYPPQQGYPLSKVTPCLNHKVTPYLNHKVTPCRNHKVTPCLNHKDIQRNNPKDIPCPSLKVQTVVARLFLRGAPMLTN